MTNEETIETEKYIFKLSKTDKKPHLVEFTVKAKNQKVEREEIINDFEHIIQEFGKWENISAGIELIKNPWSKMTKPKHLNKENYKLNSNESSEYSRYVLKGNITLEGKDDESPHLEIRELAEKIMNVERYRQFSNAIMEINKLLSKQPH